jgi:hypothetical protein
MTTPRFRARRAATTFARTMGAAALLASAGLSHAQWAPDDAVMFAHASLTNLQITLIDLTPDDGESPNAIFLTQRFTLSGLDQSYPLEPRSWTLSAPPVDFLSDPELAASGLAANVKLDTAESSSLLQEWQSRPPVGYYGLPSSSQIHQTEATVEPVASVLLGRGTGIVLRGTWSMWGTNELDPLLMPVASLDDDPRDPTLMTEVYAAFSPVGGGAGLTSLLGIASGEGWGIESHAAFHDTGTFEIGLGNNGDEEAAVALTLLASAGIHPYFHGMRIPTMPVVEPPLVIPEPGSATLMLVGLTGLLALRGRKRANPPLFTD